MMRLTKRALSAFLAFVMVFTMLPLDTWAAGISGLGGSTQSGGERIPIDPNSIAAYAETSEEVPHSENYKELYVGDTWEVSGNWTIGPGSDEYISYRNNTFTALEPGLAIIVNQGSQEVDPYTMAIRVLPVETPANAIILSAETLNFTGRETKTLTAMVTPADADQSVTWESSDTAVAVVDAAGNVTSTGEGTATITAKSKNYPSIKASCTVTVTDVQQLTGITLQNLSLVAGQTGYMEITFEPAEPLSYVAEWSVENEEIAAVGSDGKITAKQDGQTTVTVKVNGNQSAQATLIVGEYVPVTQITLNETAVTLQGTGAFQLEATVTPDNATDKVVWSSTNPETATVDENGLVTAVAPGEIDIVAEAGNQRAVCHVKVDPLSENGTTPVYVYLKLNFESGVGGSGWTPNKDGWYTIGVMYVPSDILSAPDQAYMSGDMDKVLEYLPFIQYFNGVGNNFAVASVIDLTTITWEKLLSTSGAADYGDTEGKLTWHLDGYYSIKNTQSTLTVHYVDLYGNKIAEPFTKKVNNATNVKYDILTIKGYTLDNINGVKTDPGKTQGEAVVIGDTDVYVRYKPTVTYYTVNYVDKENSSVVLDTEIIPNAKPGDIIYPQNIEQKEFSEYRYDSMSISQGGRTLYENPALNVVNVYYVKNKYNVDPIYTVVIKYQNGAGRDLHDPAVVKVHDGQKYSVDSPNVPGYHLTKANEKTVSGTLDATNPYISEEGVLTLVVVYARNPVEDDDDDPVVNPDNDPDETTEETTEETEDEVDPGVYIEDPDDYTLTPITEEEPPLADLDVGDHTCCIMHFLLMLAAMVVLGFYTDSKKKHQARIFELKRTLAMEKGKNPDGDNSQQS